MTYRWLEPTHEDFDKIRREKHPDLYAEYNQKCSLAELETLNQQMREAQTQKSQKMAQEFVESKEEKERIAQHMKPRYGKSEEDRQAESYAKSKIELKVKFDELEGQSLQNALYQQQLSDAKSMYSTFNGGKFLEDIARLYPEGIPPVDEKYVETDNIWLNPLQTATDSKYVWTGFCEQKPITGASVIIRDRYGNHHVCPHFINIDQKETDLIAWFPFERFPFVSYEN